MNNPAINLTEEQVAEFAAMGFFLVDVFRYNNDPIELSWMDDCWHRGEVVGYSVRGSNIRLESQSDDKPGELHDRLMNAMVKAGMIGQLIIMEPNQLASFGDSTAYTAEAIAARIAEMEAWKNECHEPSCSSNRRSGEWY